MKPYYSHAGVTIYHGDCREVLPEVEADVMVTDPPYGLNYESGMDNALPRISGDESLELRDSMLAAWGGPAIVFGSWKRPPPVGAHTCLVWDKGPAAGMGDLSIPWKPNWECIFVIGHGFVGRRGTAVLAGHRVVTWNSVAFGRQHPNEKPVTLMQELLGKCPPGAVLDPFMGSGTTLVAAKALGRRAVGVELEERYCEIAARRLAQEVLPFAGVA